MTPSSVLDVITLSTLDQSSLQSSKSYITRVKHRLALNNKQIYAFWFSVLNNILNLQKLSFLIWIKASDTGDYVSYCK